MAGCFFATPALTSRRSISSCFWPRSRIVGIMIVLAIVNRYVFMPAIPNGGPGLNQLRLGTIAEIVLSGGVIGLVSILGALSP